MRIFYTDGSVGANGKKAGGWAFLEVVDGKIIYEKYDVDFSSDVTNNKMELKAGIEAVKTIKIGESAKVHSDSQYVVKGISDWINSWVKKGWKTSKGEDVPNQELWNELLNETKNKDIQWIWVRGHANDEYNHRVDELSQKCYANPSKIKPEMKKKGQIVMKPNVGSVVYFDDESKKYAVILNDVRVGKTLGFLARMLANSLGNEMDFFPYDGDKFTIVESKGLKESRLTYKTIEQFKNDVVHQFHILKKKCNHNITKVHDGAVCSICNQHFGWWCPDSPDHSCHYYSKDGKVELRNGSLVDVPKNHDPYYETDDCCIFCENPDERK